MLGNLLKISFYWLGFSECNYDFAKLKSIAVIQKYVQIHNLLNPISVQLMNPKLIRRVPN